MSDDNEQGAPKIEPWSEASSAGFLELAEICVPERATQMRLVSDLLAAAWAGPRRERAILELCCGEGLLAERLLERFPEARVEALDGSAAMRQRAAGRCARFDQRFSVAAFDLTDPGWRAARAGAGYAAVVSSLAIHHLDDAGKRQLWVDLVALLEPGGRLVVIDVVAPAEPASHAVAAAEWDRATALQALDRDGHLQRFERFGALGWNLWRFPDAIDQPSTLTELCDGLRAAGFLGVDVLWLAAGHALLSAVRP